MLFFALILRGLFVLFSEIELLFPLVCIVSDRVTERRLFPLVSCDIAFVKVDFEPTL